MKKFFKLWSKFAPYITTILMALTALIGQFLGTISLFEFWTLLGLSQIISLLSTLSNAKETKTKNTQINS